MAEQPTLQLVLQDGQDACQIQGCDVRTKFFYFSGLMRDKAQAAP
jgi:hypothetical protein